MGKLTARTVEGLCKSRVPGMTNDGDSLYFKIGKGGGASWIFRYRQTGKLRDMGLGAYPGISLAEARALAFEARRAIQQGGDPISERRAASKAAEDEARRTITFAELGAQYIEAHRAGWKSTKHAQQWGNTLEQYAYPVIGKLQPSEISTEHVLKILQPIWQTKTETASRVRNRVELIWDSAKARGVTSGENPARWKGHMDALLPKRSKVAKVKHHAAMPFRQVATFVNQISQAGGMSSRALELLILTAGRTSEVLEATWDEIDLERQEWVIPAGRMKAGREHRVPLSKRAVSLLESLPRLQGSLYVFPGQRSGRPMSDMALTMCMRRHGGSAFTVHGFRSSFRDWAAERTSYPREICEMCLAHVVAQGAEAAYWRGDILDKRRGLMDLWGQYVADETGGSVIKIA
ncbi:tyrosine-type recombinase/integrase [Aeromonas sp. D3]|uniref:tyrosine-type recombinase/integrase n=1 Tax=Aeromonas sp. D3 TaxID=2990474 RepID=UPI0022E4C370|nr:site-specific integrase [Aeromonas sp. D3]